MFLRKWFIQPFLCLTNINFIKMKRRKFIKSLALGSTAIGMPAILPQGSLFASTGYAMADHVVFVAFAGIGMITPPVCVGIYTSAGVVNEDPGKAFREVPLFTTVGIIYGIMMIFSPWAATWLPAMMR